MTSSLDELLKFRQDFELGFTERNTVCIDVHGGLSTLVFEPLMGVGTTPNRMGFHFESAKAHAMYLAQCQRRGNRWAGGTGSFTREDAIKLRDMLNAYLSHTADRGADH